MTREGKSSEKKNTSYFRMPNLRFMTTRNKTVDTVEEARELGRERAKESAKKLKLKIKI